MPQTDTTGADLLCDVLLTNSVDVCFANPGTSEMHFVAALDRKPQMRCVLGLFEGVVTGAADGYARMADKPAATLLHTGPGLANGLANLHNARRAGTPVVNIVGDHAVSHLKHDAPLTSDIEGLARPMSVWVGRADHPANVRSMTEAALRNAASRRGVATVILHADAAWSRTPAENLVPVALPAAPLPDAGLLAAAVGALRGARNAVILLAGRALREQALQVAGRIAAATGATLMSQTSDRIARGAGRVAARPLSYPIDLAVQELAEFDLAICIGGRAPVGFFAYPDKPATLLPPGCRVIELAGQADDLHGSLLALAEGLGVPSGAPWQAPPLTQAAIALPQGVLDATAISALVARRLPEQAIICDESITSGGRLAELSPGLVPHDYLALTGGAIGIGVPLATGAAVACPDRKVIALQADGSGMYTLQGLWTQARENLDVVTVIYSNRRYAILQGEMRNVGVGQVGRNADRMLNIDAPALDWCLLARGMGVEAGRAASVTEFDRLLAAALARRGPFLIEAVI